MPRRATTPQITRSITMDLAGKRGPVWDQPLEIYGQTQSGPWPPAQPFQRNRLLKHLRKVNEESDPHFFYWFNLIVPEAATPEEARFWFQVYAHMPRAGKGDRAAFIDRLSEMDLSEKPSLDEMIAGFRKVEEGLFTVPVLSLQASWLSPGEMLQLVHAHGYVTAGWIHLLSLYRWLRNRYLPNLSATERELACAWVQENLPRTDWPASQLMAYCAMSLNLNESLLQCVQALPDGFFESSERALGAHPILFSLATPEDVEREVRRLRLPLLCPEHGIAWLAWTEYRGLDLIRDAVIREGKGYYAEKFTETLAAVRAPEATPYLLDIKLNSKTQAIARKAQSALDAQPGNAIVGLLPLVTQKGKLAEAALQFLRDARLRGLGEFLDQQLQSASPAVVALLSASATNAPVWSQAPIRDSEPLPEWLAEALKEAASRKQIPEWVLPATLPSVQVEGKVLPGAAVETIVRALMASTLEAPTPLVRLLAEKGDRATLANFVWALFERWLDATAPSKDRWALLALGHLGGDMAVAQLTPLIRVWPGESQHQRAVVGLDVLRTIGTDAALQALNGLAQKLKFKALQARAVAMMDAIAAGRGLSREQLGDRIVPDLGFTQNGEGPTFDYGPRKFTVVVSGELDCQVRNESGRALKDLPAAAAGDDSARVSAAQAEWKLLKKQLREIKKIQGERLEQAMVVGRRWSPEDFMTFLVRHPLVARLAQRLLWAGYNSAGKPVCFFRLTGEGSLVDAEGHPATLEGIPRVGLPHPLQLSAEEKKTWTQVFASNKLESPFPQLTRETYTLTPTEVKGSSLSPPSANVPGMGLRTRLEGNEWRRILHDQGGIVGFNKPFVAADVTAVVLLHDCLVLGYPSNDAVGIARILFVPGVNEPYNSDSGNLYKCTYVRQGDKIVEVDPGLPLAQIDPVVLSEVLRDLSNL